MPSPDFNADARQDAELRAVPVPQGILQRLRRTALVDDGRLDEAIRDLPVPAGLLERLRQIALLTDRGLDAALRDVPVTVGLPGRLQRVPRKLIRVDRLPRWAVAASLLLAVGLSCFGAMVGFLLFTYPYYTAEIPGAKPGPSFSAASSGQPELDFGVAALPGGSEPEDGPFADSPDQAPDVQLVGLDGPRWPARSEFSELFAGETGDELFLDVALHYWGVMTAQRQFDDLPELELAAGLIPRGIDWPVALGSNLHILIMHRVHPFVSPASDPRLRSIRVPLDIDSSSYDLARRYLEEGRFPPPDEVRTEEFLAAVDYEFARPNRRSLELHTAAGPSPFGGPGLRLMQIGVQARQLKADKHSPTYLILAVDVSASMRWGGRLEMIREQLSGLVRRLEPEDRISLVTFGEEARVLAREAGRDEAQQLLEVIGLLAAEGSTNVGAGLREAYAVARRGAAPPESAKRVVLLTDGLAGFGPAAADRIRQRLADAAQRGIFLDVIDLGVIDLGQEKEPDTQLAGFARSGGGKLHRASSGDEVRWALLEVAAGRSQLIAADTRLEVTFNPKTVLEYRLMGHEAKALSGLMPAHPEADFHAGQSATALYEVRLKPGGPKEVAKVELTWQEPGQSKPRTLTRTVRRGDFRSSFLDAPASLQGAALVAEAAELFRKSPYALSSRESPSLGLARVLQMAGQIDTRWYQRRSFVEFVSLLEQAQKAKPYRGR